MFHDTRISSQTDGALLKALREFIRDESMPEDLRQIADLAYLSIQNEAREKSNNGSA